MEGSSVNQFLTLSLDRERYAIPIRNVLEVLAQVKATRLPQTASFMTGIIKLRDRSVPVLDLGLRFGSTGVGQGEAGVIVVVDYDRGQGGQVFGILVDAVHEVIDIDPGSVEAVPRLGAESDAAFLSGIARDEGGFTLLIDLEQVLGAFGSPAAAPVPVAAPVPGEAPVETQARA